MTQETLLWHEQKAYEIIVGVSSGAAETEQVAIAEACRYLAYGDQTGLFGNLGRTIDVDVYGGSGEDWAIGLTFSIIYDEDDEKRFLNEMDRLSRVESVEEVSIQ